MSDSPSAFKRVTSHVKRNPVLFVMIPGLVLVHWAWYRIQYVDIFVKEHERHTGMDAMPIVRAVKKFKAKYTGDS